MPLPKAARLAGTAQPYPGLRPFDVKDAFLFFGREQHTSELLDRLSRNRMLAVVGTSGSGKSSLVRAGLLPALYRGYMTGATTRWKIALMRPGAGPLDELAAALAEPGALGGNAAEHRAALAASTLGLVSVVRHAKFEAGESLLLVVDQFEEIFRFAADSRSADAAGEALLFVTSLLEAVDQFEAPIYVALTMRTDYVGDCTVFPGLPEALNRSQYLVPRPSREQLRESIEKPIEIFGGEITPRLAQQILNDMGNDPDQLPVMQHAMARMHRLWKASGGNAPLDLDDYTKAGSLESALNDHAEAIYEGFTPSAQEWTRKIFRCLTKIERGRRIRRAGRLERIFRVVGAESEAAQAEVMEVVRVFAREENCFLFLAPAERDADRILDISHETLIRKWRRLTGWVKEEGLSAEQFSDLLRDTARQAAGETRFWVEPELGRALARKRSDGWTPSWGEQYAPTGSPSFAELEKFLKASQGRERKRKLAGYVAVAFVLVLLGTAMYALDQRRYSQSLQTRVAKMENDLNATQAALNSATTPEEKQRLQARLDELNRNLSASQPQVLQTENDVLREEIRKLKENADASNVPVTPAKASDDPHLAVIDRLTKEMGEMLPRSIYDELRREFGELEKELKVARGAAAEAAAQSKPPALSGTPQAQRTEPPNVVQTSPTPGQPARPGAARALSSARQTLLIEEDHVIPLENKGVTLLLKHMGSTAISAELFVLAGHGSPELSPMSGDRQKVDLYVKEHIKKALPSCDGGGVTAKIDGYQVWCFKVEDLLIDKRKGKIQNLGIVTVGDDNHLLFADNILSARNGSSVSVTITTEMKGVAPSSARQTLLLKEDGAIRVENKGVTLLLKHMGSAAISAELFVLAGNGSPELSPLSGDRQKMDLYVKERMKKVLPSCDGGGVMARIDGYQVWCFKVEDSLIDKKKDKIQVLGIVTAGDENHVLFADDFQSSRTGSTVSVTITTEMK